MTLQSKGHLHLMLQGILHKRKEMLNVFLKNDEESGNISRRVSRGRHSMKGKWRNIKRLCIIETITEAMCPKACKKKHMEETHGKL